MKCAREILVERENKLNELIIAKKLILTESTIRFCEEYIGPLLEKELGNFSKNPKREICFTPNCANQTNYYDVLIYYTYGDYSFDYDILKAYLNDKCFKTRMCTFKDKTSAFYANIDPKCFEVE